MPENSAPSINITKVRVGGTHAHNEQAINENFQKILFIDNSDVYVPQGDYNPATKKYVDDKVAETNIANINDLIDAMRLYSHPYAIYTTGDVTEINTAVTVSNPYITLGDACVKAVASEFPANPTQADLNKLITLGAAMAYLNGKINESGLEVTTFAAADWTESEGVYSLFIPAVPNCKVIIDSVQNSDGCEVFVDRQILNNGGATLESDNDFVGKVYYHYTKMAV